ncbi:hypothetical protein F5Y19DRAFT_165567 [Xylariaceae sp. FL1651]|nr:hypothetical protein F5Y19DRAFT_165567 [Xylariaceae sp. FL1651]
MTSSGPKPDHLERTAAEPRDKALNTLVLSHVEEVNDTIRIFRLSIPQGSPPIRFLPGQWLDVYVPGVETAGGFTITSTPREARLPHPPPAPPTSTSTSTPAKSSGGGQDGGNEHGPYLELAVQRSPENPPAAWLWSDPPASVLGARLLARVGGSFVWPPPGINVRGLRRVVFVAGGVGVNPLIAMLGSLASTGGGDYEVHFLYSLRSPPEKNEPGTPRRDARRMLFLEKIAGIFREKRVKGRLQVFLTRGGSSSSSSPAAIAAAAEAAGEEEEGAEEDKMITCAGGDLPFHARRCNADDVAEVLSTPAERRFAVVYICGVPTMTDELVARLTDRESGFGMEPHRVLCERWW